jgi:polysaccharide lyase-like protein
MKNSRKGIRLLLTIVTGMQLSQPAAAEIIFHGDWADFGSQFEREGFNTKFLNGQRVGWLAGRGPNQWRMVQEVAEDRLQVQQDPTSPKGGAVLQVEVRPGDSVGYSGERAEISEMLGPKGAKLPVTVASGHEFYGISIKLDPNWQASLHDKAHGNWQWGIFMQLHSPDGYGSPPPVAMAVEDQFHVSTLTGDLIDANGLRRNTTTVPFTNGTLRSGHWVEFLIDVVWAYDNHGSLAVYRRDEGESNFASVLSLSNTPTLQFDSQIPNSENSDPSQNAKTYLHYWKVGYYRSASPGVTSRLWLGPVVRGTNRDEVAAAAFGRQ